MLPALAALVVRRSWFLPPFLYFYPNSPYSRKRSIEGVADRVEVKTADMRELPFLENHFDVVTSNWAVHNLEAEIDRQAALSEIVRVLKPGGIVLLADIVNQAEYAEYLRRCGMEDLQLHNNTSRDAVLKVITFGSFAPSAILARKAVSQSDKR